MSMDASGTIAKTLTAAKWKGQNYIRQWFRPANPQTAGQMYTRGTMANAVTEWQAKTDPQKAEYDVLAQGTGMSGFNLYVQEYMKLYV